MKNPSVPVLSLALALLALPLHARSVPTAAPAAPQRTATSCQPVRGEWAALSPDGRLVAYSVRDRHDVRVVVATVASPTRVLSRTTVAAMGLLQSHAAFLGAPPITWMHWVSPTRIVVATDTAQRILPHSRNATVSIDPYHGLGAGVGDMDGPGTAVSVVQPVVAQGIVFAFNADGTNARTLISPKRVGASVRVVGIDPRTPDDVIVEAGNKSLAVNATNGKIRDVDPMTLSAARGAEAAWVRDCATVHEAVVAKLAKVLPRAVLSSGTAASADDRLLAYAPSSIAGGGVYVYDQPSRRILAFVGTHASR